MPFYWGLRFKVLFDYLSYAVVSIIKLLFPKEELLKCRRWDLNPHTLADTGF